MRHHERYFVLQSGLRVLLEKCDAKAARQKREHGVGGCGSDLRDFGCEISLIEAGENLASDLALVEPFKSIEGVLAGLIIHGSGNHFLIAQRVRELPGKFGKDLSGRK